MDIVLPTGRPPAENPAQATITRSEIHFRTVSRPEPHLTILLEQIDLPLPNRPKQIYNVVEKTVPEIDLRQQFEKYRL